MDRSFDGTEMYRSESRPLHGLNEKEDFTRYGIKTQANRTRTPVSTSRRTSFAAARGNCMFTTPTPKKYTRTGNMTAPAVKHVPRREIKRSQTPAHTKQHKRSNPITCSICGISVSSQATLVQHQRGAACREVATRNGAQYTPMRQQTPRKQSNRIACDICGVFLNSITSLHEHQRGAACRKFAAKKAAMAMKENIATPTRKRGPVQNLHAPPRKRAARSVLTQQNLLQSPMRVSHTRQGYAPAYTCTPGKEIFCNICGASLSSVAVLQTHQNGAACQRAARTRGDYR